LSVSSSDQWFTPGGSLVEKSVRSTIKRFWTCGAAPSPRRARSRWFVFLTAGSTAEVSAALLMNEKQ
jgi:hypothetical protein